MIMETSLHYLSREPDRHGNQRIYVRRNGKRIRIREKEGTPAFAKAYTEAVEKLGDRPRTAAVLTTHAKGTLGWLGSLYFATKNDFLKLAKESSGPGAIASRNASGSRSAIPTPSRWETARSNILRSRRPSGCSKPRTGMVRRPTAGSTYPPCAPGVPMPATCRPTQCGT